MNIDTLIIVLLFIVLILQLFLWFDTFHEKGTLENRFDKRLYLWLILSIIIVAILVLFLNNDLFYGYLLSILGFILSLVSIWLTWKIYVVTCKPNFKLIYDKGWYCCFDRKLNILSACFVKDNNILWMMDKTALSNLPTRQLVNDAVNTDGLCYCLNISKGMRAFLRTKLTMNGSCADWLKLIEKDDIDLKVVYKDPIIPIYIRTERLFLLETSKGIKQELDALHKELAASKQ